MNRLYFVFLFLICSSAYSQVDVSVLTPENVIFPSKKGSFKVTRDIAGDADAGDYDGDITVNYTITGDGADNINEVSGSVIIENGFPSKTIDLTFKSSPYIEGEEIIITITSGTGYTPYTTYNRHIAKANIYNSEPIKVFEEAYGAAAYTRAKNIASVYKVTNLNDSGAGSLREGLTSFRGSSSSHRIIVFDVSGEIKLSTPIQLGEYNGYVTIAGQTAPDKGIWISGEDLTAEPLYLNSGCNNFIARYLGFIGGQKGVAPGSIDVISAFNSYNNIYDHLTIARGHDELFSIQAVSADSINGRSSISNSLFAEGNETHSTGGHQGGSSAGNSKDYAKLNASLLNYSFYGNVFTQLSHRFFNTVGTANYELFNNVVYNWNYRINNYGYDGVNNVIGNYYKMGVVTRPRLNDPPFRKFMNKMSPNREFRQPLVYFHNNYVSDNYLPSNTPDSLAFNLAHTWFSDGVAPYDDRLLGDPYPDEYRIKTRPDLLGAAYPLKTPEQAYEDLVVNKNVGNSKGLNSDGTVFYRNVSYQEDWLNDIINDTGGAHPTVEDWDDFTVASSSRPANYDTDDDGIPNDYELIVGTDPNVFDSLGDIDNNGYTNIEDFINQIDKVSATEPVDPTPVLPTGKILGQFHIKIK